MYSRHVRKAGALLGYLPINLTFPSESESPDLHKALSQLLPSFHALNLTLETLNDSTPYAPVSQNESLHAGVLQLPQGTFLLLDETKMKEGQVTGRGVKKLQILNKVLSEQKVREHSFPCSMTD